MQSNPNVIFRWQPDRPRHDPETGEVLMYRTRPKFLKRMIKMHTQANQVCAMSLYRAVRQGDVPNQVSINELFRWLDYSYFSKKTLGCVVSNAVIYQPRLLMNRKATGPVMTYSFRNLKELEYGLEWMICSFLRKYLNHHNASDEQIVTARDMAEELDMLASSSDDMFHNDYLVDLPAWRMDDINWFDLSRDRELEWEWRENIPEPIAPKEEHKPREKPRDLSKILDTPF